MIPYAKIVLKRVIWKVDFATLGSGERRTKILEVGLEARYTRESSKLPYSRILRNGLDALDERLREQLDTWDGL